MANAINFYSRVTSYTVDNDAVLYLPCDGSDGDTLFFDYSTYNHTVVNPYSTVAVDTGASSIAFGTGSGRFLGERDSFLYVASAPELQLTGDFTIYLWVRPQDVNGARGLVSQWGDGGSEGAFYFFMAAGGELKFSYSSTGAGASEVGMVSGLSLAANSLAHIAVTRNGNSLLFFKNGVASAPNTIGTVNVATINLNISGYYDGLGIANQGWFGNMDEVVIINGRAKWTASFNTADLAGPSVPCNFYSRTDNLPINFYGL